MRRALFRKFGASDGISSPGHNGGGAIGLFFSFAYCMKGMLIFFSPFHRPLLALVHETVVQIEGDA